jgi:PKD repeat protein
VTAGVPLAAAFVGPDAVAGTQVSWDWGDGGVGTGFLASHAFAAEGNYTVTVRAVSASGTENSTSFRVVVSAAPTTGPAAGPGNTSQQNTAGGALPLPAIAGLAAAGAAAGTLVGFRLGRAKRPHPLPPVKAR